MCNQAQQATVFQLSSYSGLDGNHFNDDIWYLTFPVRIVRSAPLNIRRAYITFLCDIYSMFDLFMFLD